MRKEKLKKQEKNENPDSQSRYVYIAMSMWNQSVANKGVHPKGIYNNFHL